ncbi:hypothetical protein [Streptomyces sp. NPDC054849]
MPGSLIPPQIQPHAAGSGRHARRVGTQDVADQSAPLYARLAAEWTARGAMVPGLPDPLWERLISPEHFARETESILRRLHFAADPTPPLCLPDPEADEAPEPPTRLR